MSIKQAPQTIYQTVQQEHPTVSYWKKEEISMVISKGLAQTCREKPRNPIEFFANWLLKYNSVQKEEKQNLMQEKKISQMKNEYLEYLQILQEAEHQKQKELEEIENKKKEFWSGLEQCEDPYDYLNQLCQFIHEHVGSTGVYIGERENKFQNIKENADENAHIDCTSPEVLKFKFSDEGHKSIIQGKQLLSFQGVSHTVFTEEFTTKNEKLDLSKGQIQDLYKYVYVPEVAREKKMHFWLVPRLGAFMAVPLVYKSCLSIPSFQLAFEDFNEFQEKEFNLQQEKDAFYQHQQNIAQEKAQNGENYTPEERDWPQNILPPIKTELKKFVVCVDLLGQDKQFSSEQKAFILKTVHQFKVFWEQFEKQNLINDRDSLIHEKIQDQEYLTEEYLYNLQMQEEQIIQNILNPPVLEENKENKEQKTMESEIAIQELQQIQIRDEKMKFYLNLIENDKLYRERFDNLVNRKVIKFQLFLKCIFYILEYNKDQICFKDTQKLHWKVARHFWNDELIQQMKKAQYRNQKSHSFKQYQTLNFIEQQLQSITYEDLNQYNSALGILHKWIHVYIDARKKNIAQRLNQSKILREQREQKIQDEKDRLEDRQRACYEASDKFLVDKKAEIERYEQYQQMKLEAGQDLNDEEEDPENVKPVFDEQFFLFNYDQEHPEIQIPELVNDDIDLDWVFTEDQKEDIINDYLSNFEAPAQAPPQQPPQGKK